MSSNSGDGLNQTVKKGSFDQQAAAIQAAAKLASVNQQVDQFGISRQATPGRAQTLLTQNYGQPNTLLTISQGRR